MEWVAQTRLEAGGRSLEAACFGPPPDEAPTFVLLHEGLGCVDLWRDFPERLTEATGWGVLAYSRAGYGRSDPADLPRPLDFMTREALDVLPEVLGAVGFRTGVLFGHSDGATIAAIHSGSLQDHRVRGQVLMAPHFFTEPLGLSAIAETRARFETTDLRDRMAKYHDNPDIAFRGWADTWLDPGFEAWDVSEVIGYFRIPTLAIQGRADEYGTLAQIDAIEEAAYAPVDRLILDEVGHSPWKEAPEAVLDAVSEFTARLARIEASGKTLRMLHDSA